jgi:pimeloyl-[acyl-carrier protein] synthase
MDRYELLVNCALLLFAGHETTVNLIGNGILAIIRNPAEWEKLRAKPELARRATEECLRFDPPVKSTQRIATRDVTVGDRTIRQGERLRWIIAAANRDPDVFPDPDRFLIDRHPNPHVSLGVGIHFCLGAALARVEGPGALSRAGRASGVVPARDRGARVSAEHSVPIAERAECNDRAASLSGRHAARSAPFR